ncbi:MAG: arylsulfatase [Bacteroidota bacterium]
MKLFAHFVITVFLLLSLSSFWGCSNESNLDHNSVQPPNVIYIMTDDQGYGDVSSHGNPILRTPHLDNFATTAIEATNYHTGTTCTPTRAGLLTGRNCNRNGTWHTIAGCSILNRSEETMADVFKKNNYQTGLFGKWHLGDSYPYRPHDRGFDTAFYCKGGGVGQVPDYWNNDYFDDTYFRNGTHEKVEGYCTDVWFDEAIQFIDQRKTQPFFVYLTPNAAHSPFNLPKEYLAQYEKADLTPALKRFYGMVTNLDDNFKKLLDYLDAEGLSDNTVVVYTTDNGTAGGVHTDKKTGKKYGYNAGLRAQKGSEYDGGHRVPFYIRYPNGQLLGGKKTDELISHVDILPTLANLCQLDFTPNKPLDGTDRLDELMGKKTDANRMLLVDTQRNQWPQKEQRSCVMSRDWRLVHGDELYHTKTDPGQTTNVASEHPERVKVMNAFYDQWWASAEADFAYSPIVIGSDQEATTIVTIHDMHSETPVPWNQPHIRKATNRVEEGYYSLMVESEGNYEFSIARYPMESGLFLRAKTPSVDELPHLSGLPAGQSLNIKRIELAIGNQNYSVDVETNAQFGVLRVALAIGETTMKSRFVLEDGTKLHAYYHYIKKV